MKVIDLWTGNNAVFKAYSPAKGKASYGKNVSFDEATANGDFGGILNDGYIDISFDDEALSNKFLRMAEGNQWKCLVLKNPVNGHLHSIWRIPDRWSAKDGKDKTLAVGLVADIHHNGTAIPLRVDGVDRYPPILESENLQPAPFELFPVAMNVSLLGLSNGDGRNDALFRCIIPIQSSLGLTRSEMLPILQNINRYIFDEPLPDDEFETITRKNAFDKQSFFEGRTFRHDYLGNYLKAEHSIVSIDGAIHIYQDGFYQYSSRSVESAMIRVLPNLKSAQRAETLKYLKIICESAVYSPPKFIAFRNGILDITNAALLPHSPNYIITNMIHWDYNPNAYDKTADDVLNKLSCNDADVRSVLEECIGYCFYRFNFLQQAIILSGNGSNGKSAFITVIKHILGEDNICAIDLKKLSDRFITATLFGKLANIGDDISDQYIADASLFKKIVSGERIQAEFKGQDAFEFNPYAKLIFSANTIPKINDDTGAVKRRLLIVPFNAKFSSSDTDYDPHIEEKLSTQTAMEYFIKLGIEGLKRLLLNKRFTNSAKTIEAVESYDKENHPELLFFEETPIECILDHEPKDVYLSYHEWCIRNGYEAMPQNKLTPAINRYYGTKVDSRKIKGNRKASHRIFVQ